MRSRDVIELYDIVGLGARVTIADAPLGSIAPARGTGSTEPETLAH
jgi:hypothetical protein